MLTNPAGWTMATKEGFGTTLTQLGWDATSEHTPAPTLDTPETEEWTRGDWFEISECQHPGGWIECNTTMKIEP